MDLSVLVALFEENFEQHGHLPVDQLPDDVVELLDAPFALVCMTIVCASSPYSPEQEEFNRLLCWLDLASLQFAITAKHEPEMAEDVISTTSRVLHQLHKMVSAVRLSSTLPTCFAVTGSLSVKR